MSERTENAPLAAPHVLRVLTKDGKWEELSFNCNANFDSLASGFLERNALRPAFREGLAEAMQKMVASAQARSSVDIIDLL